MNSAAGHFSLTFSHSLFHWLFLLSPQFHFFTLFFKHPDQKLSVGESGSGSKDHVGALARLQWERKTVRSSKLCRRVQPLNNSDALARAGGGYLVALNNSCALKRTVGKMPLKPILHATQLQDGSFLAVDCILWWTTLCGFGSAVGNLLWSLGRMQKERNTALT